MVQNEPKKPVINGVCSTAQASKRFFDPGLRPALKAASRTCAWALEKGNIVQRPQ